MWGIPNITVKEQEMKTRSILLTWILCFAVAAVCIAAHAHMGTWKLNESKSKLNPNGEKNHTVVYVADGDNIKITVDGVDSEGQATHNEWTGKFDGKDYPVTGDPKTDARAYVLVDDQTLHMNSKKGGKPVAEVHIVVSADGKTRTVTVNSTDSEGKKISTTAVYDKQ
jgi:endonuclease YncB( thermonuclease family)